MSCVFFTYTVGGIGYRLEPTTHETNVGGVVNDKCRSLNLQVYTLDKGYAGEPERPY